MSRAHLPHPDSRSRSLRAALQLLALLLACVMLASGGGAQAQPSGTPPLAANPAPVLWLTTPVVLPARVARMAQLAGEAGVPLQVIPAHQADPAVLQPLLARARLLVIDAPHPSLVEGTAARWGAAIERSGVPYVLVGERSAVTAGQAVAAAPLQAERGVGAAWAQRLREYWRFGGGNTALAVRALASLPGATDAAAAAALPPALPLPAAGFYHPRWARLESDGRLAARGLPGDRRATVAIAVNSAVFTGDDTGWLDALFAALEVRGLAAYAFYGPRQQPDLFHAMTHVSEAGMTPRRIADIVINAALVFNPRERSLDLERIAVPVLQVMPSLNVDAAGWARSRDGLAASDVAYYYSPGEMAGTIDPMLVSARHAVTGALEPLPAQLAAVADKAAALVRLQQSPPAERRVALVVYNYPQGESNFGASFLNVPRSLHNMLAAMRGAGYRTEAPPAQEITPRVQATLAAGYRPEVLAALPAQGLADTLPLAAYLAWFSSLPGETQQRIQAHWGPPETATTLRRQAGPDGGTQAAFVIPRLALGNVVILPQPLRHETAAAAAGKRRQAIGHRSPVPLGHDYLATYLWLRMQFGAHAVVHVGTHGTLEWAPGKERGLSIQDDPLLALGDLPNIYPYIMDNLGEALTAKRRGRAVLVSHATPMFSPAGFRPGMHDMHDLMHEWDTLAPGPVRRALEARLADHFVAHRLDRDLSWPRAQIRADFGGFMERLHPYLDDIAQTAQPLGLATFGEVPDASRRFGTVLQILRKPLIEALGEDIDEVFLLDAEKLAHSRPARWLQVALRDPQAASTLDLRRADALAGPASPVPNRAAGKPLDPQVLLALAKRAQVLEAALAANGEIAGLLAALDGKHLVASYGGDPVRNPDSLPTGRNLYGFDPNRVPTRQAWDIGVATFDQWAAQHRAAHGGRWPAKMAFTLWAGETLRHQGVMEAQVLHALGLRPHWDEAGRIARLDVVPRSELGRPRLDVLVSVSGSYRDQFPAVMRWLDEGVRRVAALQEADNAVSRNTSALARRFAAAGADPALAARWATARVFSNEQGGYGTGLAEAALASDLWRRQSAGGGDAAMASLYVDRMGHAYGEGLASDPSTRPRTVASAFSQNLAQVDAAVLSRSSHTYGMLTSDDPFQYLGGMAQAVRLLSGKDPALYVQNLRDPDEVKVDTAATALAKEMQTRYLHPQWILAQKGEGYSGTLQVLKAVQFLWGWQVTAPATVRQDHWQSMHDVYVRDRYRLGTRQWLEGDNRAAFAQTLERMLDAVRLGYWRPDAATRRELLSAYDEAVKATDLRESNAAVRRFAQAATAPVRPGRDSQGPAAETPRLQAPGRAPAAHAPQAAPIVSGLRLDPRPVEPATTPPAPGASLVNRLAALWILASLLVLGAWRQSRRWRLRPGSPAMAWRGGA